MNALKVSTTAMIMPCVMTVLEVSSAFVVLATQVMGLKTAQVVMANYLHFLFQFLVFHSQILMNVL